MRSSYNKFIVIGEFIMESVPKPCYIRIHFITSKLGYNTQTQTPTHTNTHTLSVPELI